MAKITYADKVAGAPAPQGKGRAVDFNEIKTSVNALYDEVDAITVPTFTSELTNDSNFVVDADYTHTDNNFSDAAVIAVSEIADKVDKPTTSATLTPSSISLAKEAGTSYDTYQQTGVLALVVTGTGSVVGGNADFDIIKTADAITVLVDAVDITTIGKWPTSNDFSTIVGDIDHVVIFKKEPNTNNATGVYYMVTNLG